MKICFVLATRPEIIKTSPIIKIFEKNTKKKVNYLLKEKRIGELDYTCCK